MKNNRRPENADAKLKAPDSQIAYRNALIDAAEVGAWKALDMAGLIKPFVTASEAGRLFGAKRVSRWIDEGLIEWIHDGKGSGRRLDLTKLRAVALSSNPNTYSTE